MKQGILFDLDGTLWDSSKEVAASWEEALRKRPDVQKEITSEMIRGVMGKSMHEIADILFGEYDLKTRRSLMDYCCEEENKYIRLMGGRLLEGLEETLQALRAAGFHLYIVSNCQVGYIEAFLEHHGLGQYFEDFECFGKTEQGKGHNIRLVAERNHLDLALYVGDTQGDYLAATQAGLPFIHARMGYGAVEAQVPFITALPQLPQAARRIFGEWQKDGKTAAIARAAQRAEQHDRGGKGRMKKIGIIGAMAQEVERLKSEMEVRRTVSKASMEFWEGILCGTEAVVVQSGIGKVNAAICAQILCDLFAVTHIINTGVAGSLKNEIDIGDIVVSTDALHHDMDAQVLGVKLGEVPQAGCLAFPADAHLQQLAVSCCKEVDAGHAVYQGRIVSGDQFISDRQVKDKIIENFQGFCVEMEGAPIAQAAYLNQVPFVIIRAISDKADDSATMDFPVFEKEAAARSAALVEQMLPLI